MLKSLNIQRRSLLLGGAGIVAAGGLGARSFAQEAGTASVPSPLPKDLHWKNDDALIVHSANTIETKREHAGRSIITPLDELFVRNNVAPPPSAITENPDAWQVSIEGVKEPRTMTVAELKTIGVETVASVLQCSGNGRGFFDHKPSGTAWTVGAAGCVLWTGVPVRAVVEALGDLVAGSQFMTGTGGEPIPAGLDPNTLVVERSLPLEAMETAILAWEANGKPLPLAHGGPLRLIVPGYFGVNNIKYITKLAFTEQESQARIQASSYRVRPMGEKGGAGFPSMWKMPIKSWIRDPVTTAASGRVQIHGIAFGGEGGVKSVEVSTDGGESWRPARLVGPDLGPYAWRTFVLSAELKPGQVVLASRGTDSSGTQQPEVMEINERGYGHNGWRSHAVTVTIT